MAIVTPTWGTAITARSKADRVSIELKQPQEDNFLALGTKRCMDWKITYIFKHLDSMMHQKFLHFSLFKKGKAYAIFMQTKMKGTLILWERLILIDHWYKTQQFSDYQPVIHSHFALSPAAASQLLHCHLALSDQQHLLCFSIVTSLFLQQQQILFFFSIDTWDTVISNNF